jgi:hypothetical protein
MMLEMSQGGQQFLQGDHGQGTSAAFKVSSIGALATLLIVALFS